MGCAKTKNKAEAETLATNFKLESYTHILARLLNGSIAFS